jgi:DDE superfamily endonuclease
LFAAMNIRDGSVIDVCMPTHHRWDWIRFLKLIESRTPPDRAIHLIMDNYSAHKAPEVQKWLARRKRFHTPTGSPPVPRG